MNDYLTECREMARKLTGQRVYVEDAAILEGLPVRRGDCYGWTFAGGYYDLNAADRIGDRWEGPAPQVFIDVDAIREDAKPGCFEQCLWTVTAHELAHHAWGQEMLSIPDTASAREWQVSRLAKMTSSKPIEFGEPLDPHGPAFIKRAIHLYVRAEAQGYSLALNDLIGARGIVASGYSYLPLLVGEAVRMIERPISEIDALPTPATVTEQYAADAAYQRNYKETST